MISLKYAVVILTLASYSIATALDPDYTKEHWDMVKSSLNEMFPGITCGIDTNNSTIQSPPNLITLSIESALMDVHPSISCTGELDEGAFLKGFNESSQVLEKRADVPVSFILRLIVFGTKRTRFPTSCLSSMLISKHMCVPCCCPECPNSEYHAAQAAAPHPDQKTSQDVQSETQAEKAIGLKEQQSGYVSCSNANHPDSCKACVSINSNKTPHNGSVYSNGCWLT
jgi:hypothetical protein